MSVLGAAARRNTRAIAFLRICVGSLFLVFAQYKVFGTEFTSGGGFQFWINRFIADGAYPFMLPVLRDFVLPHATTIAILVAYGELAIGLSLVFGLLVKTASACGVAYMLVLLLSANYPGPAAAFWQYFGGSLEHSVFALCFVTFILGDSTATLSLRHFLDRRQGDTGVTTP